LPRIDLIRQELTQAFSFQHLQSRERQIAEVAMKNIKEVETVIVGGGQAGLAVSYYLTLRGQDHVVLEQANQAANAWRNHRWDSFTLNTPNWQSQLQDGGMPGNDPDGYLTRDEVIAYFENYIERNQLPVQYGIRVSAIKPSLYGYSVETNDGCFRAKNVVVATGVYQQPRIPRFTGALSPDILQVHSDSYRNPDLLPPGAVLVAGSAQSGAQIAEELYQSGRKVYLSVSRSGRVPRRYRGKDVNWWSHALGLYDRTVGELKSPRERFDSKPHISGTRGGHTLNLHQFASDGVTLLGRVMELDGDKVRLAQDLHRNLAAADQFEAHTTARIDSYVQEHGMAVPQEVLPKLTAGFEQPERDELDLKQANVKSVIWATGYSFDFGLVRLPILDADGYPIQQRGVTAYPGLYFVGMPWLHNARSGLIFGVSEDAWHVASHISVRELPETLYWPELLENRLAFEI
jgi:putative flavoprotein involved in K+ transport